MSSTIVIELIVNVVIFVIVFGVLLIRGPKLFNKPITNSRRVVLPLFSVIIVLVLCWRFLTPNTQYPPSWAIVLTVIIGVALSLPVTAATKYERRSDGRIYVVKNRMFMWTLAILFVLKVLGVVAFQHVNTTTVTFLIYVLVAAYFVPWRVMSWIRYRHTSQ